MISAAYNLIVLIPVLLRIKFINVNNNVDMTLSITMSVVLAPVMTMVGFSAAIYASFASSNYGVYDMYVSLAKSIGTNK